MLGFISRVQSRSNIHGFPEASHCNIHSLTLQWWQPAFWFGVFIEERWRKSAASQALVWRLWLVVVDGIWQWLPHLELFGQWESAGEWHQRAEGRQSMACGTQPSLASLPIYKTGRSAWIFGEISSQKTNLCLLKAWHINCLHMHLISTGFEKVFGGSQRAGETSHSVCLSLFLCQNHVIYVKCLINQSLTFWHAKIHPFESRLSRLCKTQDTFLPALQWISLCYQLSEHWHLFCSIALHIKLLSKARSLFFFPSGCIAKVQSSSKIFQLGILWKNLNFFNVFHVVRLSHPF